MINGVGGGFAVRVSGGGRGMIEPVTATDELSEPQLEQDAKAESADLEEVQAELDDVQPDEPEAIDLDALPGGARGALEAILVVVERPVDEVSMAAALGIGVAEVTELIAQLVVDYEASNRGFELRRVAGGWRIFSHAAYAPVVGRFVLDGQTAKLTQAGLETLAIVAYRQPVSRARVSAVRGVNVDGVMRTLVTRGLVEETGTDPQTGAVLYGTTELFLHKLGLTSLDELPALAPYLPEADAIDEISGDMT